MPGSDPVKIDEDRETCQELHEPIHHLLELNLGHLTISLWLLGLLLQVR